MESVTVSKSFRDQVIKAYPRLEDRREWFELFQLLAFGTRAEERDGKRRLILTHEDLLACCDLPTSTPSKKFNSGDFVAVFAREVLRAPVDLTAYHHDGTARTVVNAGLGKIKAALELERTGFFSAPPDARVDLLTGRRVTERTRAVRREEHRSNAAAAVPTAPEAARLAAYLNSQPSNVFAAKVRENMAAAIAATSAMPTGSRIQQLLLMRKIAEQPQPFYGASSDGQTVRLFARNPSVLATRNAVKYALIQGWCTFDLKAAQLAIAAKDWGATELQAWMSAEGNDIWQELCAAVGQADVVKPMVKQAVYSVCFGGNAETITQCLARGLTEVDVDPAGGLRLVDHRLIRDLLVARDRHKAQVIRGKGASDCFGRAVPYSKGSNVRSVMAQLCQAQEMALLLPALELAEQELATKARPDFRIVLWEHDGLSVHFVRSAQRHAARITDAVNENCRARGYATRLVQKVALVPP